MISLPVPAAEPGRPVRTGVIGQGRWGSRLTEALRRSNRFRIEALCDTRRECLPVDGSLLVTERSADLIGAGLEAVVIATHPRFHAELAVAALESGHHVLVEKPCALSRRDAERICLTAERTRQVVCVGHLLRYHAAYERLVELGRSGTLGSLLGAVAERVGSRPRPDVDSWWMLAPHDLSVLHALFGGPADEVRRCRIAEDDFVAGARFGSAGATLWVRSGGASSRRFAVVGSHTTALFDDLNEPGTLRLTSTEAPGLRALVALCALSSKGAEPSAHAVELALTQAFQEPAELMNVPVQPPLERELEAFASAIRERTPLATSARDGLAVVGMLEAGLVERHSSSEAFADDRAEPRVAGLEP
jgi:predicted dehydrogenase